MQTRLNSSRFFVPVAVLAVFTMLARGEAPPKEPAKVLEWVAQRWNQAGWTLPSKKHRYMRPLDDTGWQARMLALRQLVLAGEKSVPPLLRALESRDRSLRILAAQALGFLAPHPPAEKLLDLYRKDRDASVRLYAVDSLGMQGGNPLRPVLEPLLQQEKGRDVKKHIHYAMERNGAGVAPDVIQALKSWAPGTINSAEIGKPAPDFSLRTISGDSVRLSDFRGKPVVLVFIYGDT